VPLYLNCEVPTDPAMANATPEATVTTTPTPASSSAPRSATGPHQTGRVTIPADLMKRLSTQPTKPAVTLPVAAAGAAPR